MIQLRYLIKVELDHTVSQRQPNGSIVDTYSKVDDYLIQTQELTDEISASIYGANVNRMMRVSSPHHLLESFLSSKMNKSSDNISLYTLIIDNKRYKVVNVRRYWVDIELL